uniref:Ionotropic receptor n=1 Tax=Bracon brevicornis TaxID=1563983 RepID=A0A6V7K1E4_9HYME
MNIMKLIILITLSSTINCDVEYDIGQDIVSYVFNNRAIEMVTFVSNQNKTLRHLVGEQLFYQIIKNISTLNLDINNFLNFDAKSSRPLRGISALMIYIHHPSAKGLLPSIQVIDAMKQISLDKTIAKYLIIHYSYKRNKHLEETLKYAWREQQMLDFTIIEMINEPPRKMPTGKRLNNSFSEILIHQFNPFLNKIYVSPYSKNHNLFPRFIDDMHGYPLKIGIRNVPPFSYIKKGSGGRIELGGENKVFMDTLSGMMNFTPVFVAQPYRRHATLQEMLVPLVQNKQDIEARLYAHLSENLTLNRMRTAPVDGDELCAVVPFIRKERSLWFSPETSGAYVFTFFILILFWILERFTNLDSQYWSPFTVIMILFGVSARRQPKPFADRIMFISLVLVAMVYSTKLYTSITHGVVSKVKASKWETLEELSASDITLFIHPMYFNKTFAYAEGVILDLKKKTVTKRDAIACLGLMMKNKNVSCLMSKNEFDVIQRYIPRYTMKIVKPCLWRDSTAFLLSSKSPYHERIRQIITHFHEKGFKQKWYHIGLGRRPLRTNQFFFSESIAETSSVLKPSLIILSIGYSLAIIAFIGEIIYARKFERA